MKARYGVNDKNQLIINLGKEVLTPCGEFIVDKGNRLTYIIKEPKDWRLSHAMPERINLEGKWSLDENHDLVFNLRKTTTQKSSQRLLLKTELKEAKAASLIFSLGTEGLSSTHELRLLELKGIWQVDKSNRLQFLLNHLNTNRGVLTFQGAWYLKCNTIIYTYKETSLITKKKYDNTLRFQGYWDIKGPRHLTYILDIKNNSYFDFKFYYETPNLIAKKGFIKYRAGIGAKGKKLFSPEIITLYGVWKPDKKGGISFEMDYDGNKVKAIKFQPFLNISDSDKILFGLRLQNNKKTGFTLEYNRSFLKKEANWFIKLAKQANEKSIRAGIKIPW